MYYYVLIKIQFYRKSNTYRFEESAQRNENLNFGYNHLQVFVREFAAPRAITNMHIFSNPPRNFINLFLITGTTTIFRSPFKHSLYIRLGCRKS